VRDDGGAVNGRLLVVAGGERPRHCLMWRYRRSIPFWFSSSPASGPTGRPPVIHAASGGLFGRRVRGSRPCSRGRADAGGSRATSSPCPHGPRPVECAGGRCPVRPVAAPSTVRTSASHPPARRDQRYQRQPVAVDELVDLRRQPARGAADAVIRRRVGVASSVCGSPRAASGGNGGRGERVRRGPGIREGGRCEVQHGVCFWLRLSG
jgi:hypothetical protein